MYCTAPLSPRKERLRSVRDDDNDDDLQGLKLISWGRNVRLMLVLLAYLYSCLMLMNESMNKFGCNV